MIERQRQVVNEWSPGGYTMANVEFHAAIFELANNEYLTAQLPIVHMTSQVFTPAALLDKDRAERAVNEHSLIADAITRGDAKEAERLARQHIHTTIDDLQSVYIGRSQLDGEVAL